MAIENFKQLLIQFVGEYTPDYQASDWGQIDWVWILGAIVLLHLLICFFKAIRHIFHFTFKGWTS